MQSNLLAISDEMQSFVRVIEAFYTVDIDLVDDRLIRVIGTGRYGNDFGKTNKYSHLAEISLKTRDTVLRFYPPQEEPCKSCPNRPYCGNFARLLFPIWDEGKVAGVLSITARSQEQSRQLHAEQDRVSLFMKTIADAISTRIRQYRDRNRHEQQNRLLQQLVNTVKDGAMVLDGDNLVHFINKRGENILGSTFRQIQSLAREGLFSVTHVKTTTGTSEFQAKIRTTRFRLIGEVHEVGAEDPAARRRIFVFADLKTLQSNRSLPGGDANCTFDTIICESPAFMETVEACRKVAFHLTPVLLHGEIASGKEVLARAIHNEGQLRNNRFIRIAHGSELQQFLRHDTPGVDAQDGGGYVFQSEALDGNTVYVDEVSDLTLENQCIVLALVQRSRDLGFRIICSTSKDLEALAEKGDFHPELYHSLEVYQIFIPPVRERGKDILLLANHYLAIANGQAHKNLRLAKGLQAKLLDYPWRGNIREIENTMTFLVGQVEQDDGEIGFGQLPSALQKKLSSRRKPDYNLENSEKRLIVKALNDQSLASRPRAKIARELGISPATLYRKLKQYDIKSNLKFE